jgi:hypothetical protein
MAYYSNVAKLIASTIVRDVTTARLIAETVADNVTKSVQDSILKDPLQKEPVDSQPRTEDPQKMPYYVARALGEVRQIIEDANFEIGGILEEEAATIKNIFFSEDSGSKVVVVKSFNAATGSNYEAIKPAFSRYNLRPELAKFVTFSITTPTVDNPAVVMTINILLPEALLEDMGATDFEERTHVVQQYVQDLLKDEDL